MGNKMRIKVVKNKVVFLFCMVEVDIMYGEGIFKEGEIIDFGIEFDIVQKSGLWYFYEEECFGQGCENVKQFLKENKDIMLMI